MNRLSRPWVAASIATALVTLGLGGFAGSLGNVCRPVFTVIGPMLTLSAATLHAGRPTGNWGNRSTIKW
jgi:hypothetical protein